MLKISTYHNPKKLSTSKNNKHIASDYSLFTNCLFDATKNKLDCYRLYEKREHATKTINYEKKKKK